MPIDAHDWIVMDSQYQAVLLTGLERGAVGIATAGAAPTQGVWVQVYGVYGRYSMNYPWARDTNVFGAST